MTTPKTLKISTGSSKDGTKRDATFTYHQFPETLEEAVVLLGEKGVLKEFQQSFISTIQGPARKYLQAVDTSIHADLYSVLVQEHMDTWKYGEKPIRAPRTPKDPIATFAKLWKEAGEEERARLVAKYDLGIPMMNGTPHENESTDGSDPDLGKELEVQNPHQVRSQRMAGSRR